jgi:hypothetical protein
MIDAEKSWQCDRGRRMMQLLSQHDRRRREGVSTVSVVVGDRDGKSLWLSWTNADEKPSLFVIDGTVRDWHEQWTRLAFANIDATRVADDHLVARGVIPETASRDWLTTKTPYAMEQLCEQARLSNHGMEPDRLCRWILDCRCRRLPVTAATLVHKQREWMQATASGVFDAFRQLYRFLPSKSLPAILVRSDRTMRQSPTAIYRLTSQVVQLAVHVPEITIGLLIDHDSWQTYQQQASPSFAKSMLQEHVVSLEIMHVKADREKISVLKPSEAADQAILAAPVNSTENVIEGCVDPWKSQQERLLFEVLEGAPDLRGLFALNAKPGFVFGNRCAEIDLACIELKIAIEVDGYYHFANSDGYRRDRRKDVLLQQHGYFVLRFLAEDIPTQSAAILSTVRSVVSCRAGVSPR